MMAAMSTLTLMSTGSRSIAMTDGTSMMSAPMMSQRTAARSMSSPRWVRGAARVAVPGGARSVSVSAV